jgi:O-antigen ligase
LFAYALESSALLCAFLLYKFRSKLIFVAFLFLVATLISTTSRGGVLALTFGASIVYFLSSKNKAILLFLALIVFCTDLIIQEAGYDVWFTPKGIIARAGDTVTNVRSDSTEGRSMIYAKTFEYIKKRPLLGWGTYRQFPGKPNWPYLGSHSSYFSILFRTGVLGLLIFFMFIFYVVSILFKCRRMESNLSNFKLSNFLLGTMAMQIAHMGVLDVNDDVLVLDLVWIIWGLAPCLANILSKKDKEYALASNPS